MALMVCASGMAQINTETAIGEFKTANVNKHLNETDYQSIRITSEHVSSVSGVHHLYFMQEYQGIGIYGAVGSAHYSNEDNLIKAHSNFGSKIDLRSNTVRPKLTAAEAILTAAKQLGYDYSGQLTQIENIGTAEQKMILRNRTISLNDIPARLMFHQSTNGELLLSWDFNILEVSEKNWWSLRVDALTGRILDQVNWTVSCNFDHSDGHQHTASCSDQKQNNSIENRSSNSMVGGYNVYAMPLQSPADGNRTIEVDPDDATASPFGWHDTDGAVGPEFTITRGNNAHAYDDGDNPGFSPDGGATLQFDFPIDTTYSSGNQSEPAAITNLFYWTNIIHDVWYYYGFDEASGNFQENNYGNGGAGSDYVLSEAQDGSGTCNANFSTPNDGSNPRMQMYVCGDRDGDLDNLVIVHEYAHGISNRLTGGGGNTGCLNNSEQMGEGWSDYYGLMMTIQTGDQGIDAVGVGTWLTGEPIGGPGIRPHPYSTDLVINPHTYDDIKTEAVPHGVGSVWCQMLWEMTWGLIDEYGFDPDFYTGTGGNNIAMQLVTEGLKLQPCNPGFVDGRDAILLADSLLYGSANSCLIWDAFAKRGLGVSASQGSSGSRADGVEAFDVPGGGFAMSKDVDLAVAGPGDTLTYTIRIDNGGICSDTLYNIQVIDTLPPNTFYVANSASNGGSISGDVISFPTVSTFEPGTDRTYTFQVYVDPAYTLSGNFFDNMESGTSNWTISSTGSNDWSLDGSNVFSGSNAWFAPDVSPSEDQYLELNEDILVVNNALLSFWHAYDTEARWDGGVVQFSLDGGSNWNDLGPFMIKNGYNSTIDNSSTKPAFSGNSGGYIETVVDLSSFDGQTLNIRFWMSCDQSVTGDGWYVDDVTVLQDYVNNIAYADASNGFTASAQVDPVTEIFFLQCTNGIQDGDEEGIDCGGTFCPPCPSCTDGIQNGDETDIDCGGPDCPPCPTCEDGIQNRDEEGIDCGGTFCDPCPCLENDLSLVFRFDNYPEDITWEFMDTLGNILFSGGPYGSEPDGSTLVIDLCVEDSCYTLNINDDFGDGFLGDGYYALIDNSDSTFLAFGDNIDDGDTTTFCLEAPPLGVCDSLLEVNGIIAADIYHAANILRSNGTVESPDSVIFKAGDAIELEPEFNVELGAIFTADIEACISALKLIQNKKEAIRSEREKAKTRVE